MKISVITTCIFPIIGYNYYMDNTNIEAKKMNPQELQIGQWIFADAIFGARPYKIDGIRNIGENGAEIKTAYGTATFSIMIGESNWRYATMSDLGK